MCNSGCHRAGRRAHNLAPGLRLSHHQHQTCFRPTHGHPPGSARGAQGAQHHRGHCCWAMGTAPALHVPLCPTPGSLVRACAVLAELAVASRLRMYRNYADDRCDAHQHPHCSGRRARYGGQLAAATLRACMRTERRWWRPRLAGRKGGGALAWEMHVGLAGCGARRPGAATAKPR